MSYSKYIEINPEKRFGKPIIAGTRISVVDAIDWLKSGMTIDDIISDFPELNEKQIKACKAYSETV